MLDRYLHPPLKPVLARLVGGLDRQGIKADHLTLLGFAVGVLALPLLLWQQYDAALAAVVFNRVCDGLDGALARRQGLSDAGGFLDIALDFLFYALIPLGFVLADPAQNALPGAWLLCAFIGTGSSFLAFAALAQKHHLQAVAYPHKSFYYLGGLTEGTETIALFVACCLWPSLFVPLAWLFGALCWLTTLTRVWGGYHTLRRLAQGENPPSGPCS